MHSFYLWFACVFQGEVLNTAAYLVNKSPSSTIGFKCLEEKWIRRKLNLFYLRVVGCEVFAHNTDEKLEPRSSRCLFLGYQDGKKGYWLWERETGGVKIIISKDVIFNEKVFPCKAISHDVDTMQPIDSKYSFVGGGA